MKMYNVYKFLLSSVILLVALSCSHPNRPVLKSDYQPSSTDTIVTHQTCPVEAFHGVSVSHVSTVDIEVGPACDVQVEGIQSVVNQNSSQVTDGVLHIGYLQQNDKQRRQMHVRIKAPALDEICVCDAGQVLVHGKPLVGKSLRVNLSGVNVAHLNACMQMHEIVGDVNDVMFTNLHVDCHRLFLSAKRAEHIQLRGKTHYYHFDGDHKRVDTQQLHQS